MKPKNFSTEKGKYTVVATFTNRNEVTHEDDENTIRTYERPRPKLYNEFATLALYVRQYYGLESHKLRISTIGFAENKIIEYLNGDREAPVLPEIVAVPEKQPGLFGRIGRRKKAG